MQKGMYRTARIVSLTSYYITFPSLHPPPQMNSTQKHPILIKGVNLIRFIISVHFSLIFHFITHHITLHSRRIESKQAAFPKKNTNLSAAFIPLKFHHQPKKEGKFSFIYSFFQHTNNQRAVSQSTVTP